MNSKIIYDYLDHLIENPKTELNYNKDYELLIAVMLSVQTTDKRVNLVTQVLFNKYKSLEELKEANLDDITNMVRSLGTYKKKAKNIIEIASSLESLGYVPNDRAFLESLPGVGRKTANVILSSLYNEQVIAVDTHVTRVSKRLKLASNKDDVLKIEHKLTKKFKDYDLNIVHHLLILFGRYYCKAKKPLCSTCGLKDMCDYYNKTIKKS